ncbi:hypothetical protein [Halobacteriovorax sp. HLS]|uniref:hypothetical protein n=1 Tax=Halobacteriovorax sp. HLS TaxID=2234000 RepID=UPI000FDAF4A1|nr:hypothetical protein [Halobacteriovorax sp. HLS]
MSPRLQIVKNDKIVTIIGDFAEDKLLLNEATDYFKNWLNEYQEVLEDDCHFYFEDKTGNKTEFKLQ